ncbi:RNI-like protein, partial [Conidiobolus coronatus NRRL 28638]
KKVVAKSKECLQKDIWSINSIISNIFAYTEFKDLVKLNTVCKRWNNVANPIIYRSIKLQRRRAFQNKDHEKNLVKSAKTGAEAELCISNNAKHAPFIKDFKFSEYLKPQTAIKFFETFRFISNLTIERVSMSQDQFISMIIPLSQLQELNLRSIGIKKIVAKKYITEPAVLPQSLKKLSLEHIDLYKNPELFIQTINSHMNLIEFKYNYYKTVEFLDPFLKNYPTLKSFEFNNAQLDDTQSLIKVFQFNPQLTCLKSGPSNFNNNLISNINHHLTNLEEFSFKEIYVHNRDASTVVSKFSQFTNIKKLSLSNDKLSECTINSILLNCPDLEELNLRSESIYRASISNISFKFPTTIKLKKLTINCDYYTKSSFDTILPMFSHLKELNIKLPIEWKDCIQYIARKCTKLEYLTILPPKTAYGQEMDRLNQELHQNIFLNSNSVYKSTLKHLTLNGLNIYESNG